jgi:hypothetical protein
MNSNLVQIELAHKKIPTPGTLPQISLEMDDRLSRIMRYVQLEMQESGCGETRVAHVVLALLREGPVGTMTSESRLLVRQKLHERLCSSPTNVVSEENAQKVSRIFRYMRAAAEKAGTKRLTANHLAIAIIKADFTESRLLREVKLNIRTLRKLL